MMKIIRPPARISYRLYCSRRLILAILSLAFANGTSAAANACCPSQQGLPQIQAEIEKQKLRLHSPEIEERRDAVMRLGALRHADASRVAVSALADPSAIVRIAAAVAVSFLPPDESAVALIPLLNDKDPFVRQEVAYALGGIHNPEAVAALVERLSDDKVDGVRSAAAVALGKTKDEVAVVPLAQVLSAANSSPRGRRKRKAKESEFVLRAVAQSLGEIGSRAGVPALVEVLLSDSVADDVKREAAQSLGLIGDPSATPALQAAASGNDPHLSRIATAALHKISLAEPKKRS